MTILSIVAALLAVVAGSFFVTRFAQGLVAGRLHPVIVGAAITLLCSAPEIAVILGARLQLELSKDALGVLDVLGLANHIPIGVVLGSSLINILLIAGLSALIVPTHNIVVSKTTVFRDALILAVLAIGGFILIFTNLISPEHPGLIPAKFGLWLIGLGVAYLVGVMAWEITLPSSVGNGGEEAGQSPTSLGSMAFFFVCAISVLFIGVLWLFQTLYPNKTWPEILPPHSVGVLLPLLVAVPELATAFWAAGIGGQAGRSAEALAIDSLLSSSIFNLTFVLGLAIVMAPGAINTMPKDMNTWDTVRSSLQTSIAASNALNRPNIDLRFQPSLEACAPSDGHSFQTPFKYCFQESDLPRSDQKYFSINRLPPSTTADEDHPENAIGLYVDRPYFMLEACTLVIGVIILMFVLMTDRFHVSDSYQLLPHEGAILLFVFICYGVLRYGPIIAGAPGSGHVAVAPEFLRPVLSLDYESEQCRSEIKKICKLGTAR